MDAKKFFGQNFITDKNLILKIISLLKNDGNTLVIEIGPGHGALTKTLVQQFRKVIAIEIDRDLEDVLKTKITEPNFELIIGDVLTLDLEPIIKLEMNNFKSVVLISNTPYYITSEILFKSFQMHQILLQAVFMFQKEVAERVCAKVGDKKYNNLSITTQFYANPKYEFTVKKNMFNPVPKVDSAIVSLDFEKNQTRNINDELEFIKFVRKLFNNRRKTILNNFKMMNEFTFHEEKLKSCGINPQLRPENLSLNDFKRLYTFTKEN